MNAHAVGFDLCQACSRSPIALPREAPIASDGRNTPAGTFAEGLVPKQFIWYAIRTFIPNVQAVRRSLSPAVVTRTKVVGQTVFPLQVEKQLGDWELKEASQLTCTSPNYPRWRHNL